MKYIPVKENSWTSFCNPRNNLFLSGNIFNNASSILRTCNPIEESSLIEPDAELALGGLKKKDCIVAAIDTWGDAVEVKRREDED